MRLKIFIIGMVLLLSGNIFGLAVGDAAPDYKSQLLDGTKVSLSQYKGKVVILKFWAKWCGPCIRSLPKTNKLQKKYGSQGLVVFAVGVSNNKNNDANYLKTKRYSLKVQSYSGGWKTAPYKVKGIPYEVLIDRNGKILWMGHFGMKESMIQKALNSRSSVETKTTTTAPSELDNAIDEEKRAENS